MSTHQIVPKVTCQVVDPTQQIAQMSEMISYMTVNQGLNARAALDVINVAAQKEIDALKSQVAAMEKTVAALQRALAESQSRAIQNPRVYAAKRLAEKAEVEALKKQIAETDRLEASLLSVQLAKENELQAILEAYWLFQRAGYWTEGKYPAGMIFIRMYVGESVYKRDINRKLAQSFFKDV